MLFGVGVGMPLRVTMPRTVSSSSWARIALPMPVACIKPRRPTSVIIRMECRDGTWATYITMSESSTAMLAVSPSRSTSDWSSGRASAPSCLFAASPRRIRRGPSA